MGEAPEIVLERIRRTHADGSPGAPTRQGTLRVSNEEFPATEYEGRAGERVVFGRIASADGTALVATCFARSEIFEQCLRALDEVARDGFPAYAKPLPGPTKIGERVLKTPQECTLVGNNRIRCPATEFHWGNADARMDKVIAENMQRGLERLGSVSHSRAACTLLDVGTDCHVFRVARPEGPMTVVIGVATTPVGMFFAQCNSFDTRLGLTPVPCDQVLAMGKN